MVQKHLYWVNTIGPTDLERRKPPFLIHWLLSISATCVFYREFNTEVDIRLRKWADSLNLANLCIKVLVEGIVV